MRRSTLSAALLLRAAYILLLVATVMCGPALAQILEITNDSLTSYLPGRTECQDARPMHRQRGVNVEGSMRKPSTFPFAVAGNPFENAWQGDAEQNGVRLDTGTWSPTEVDIALPAPGFRWVIGRTYNARQDDSGQYDSNGYQGYNWFQTSQPELVYFTHGSDAAKNMVYLVYGADRFVEFLRTGSSADTYKATNGAGGLIERTGGSPDTFAYYSPDGIVATFFGFNTSDSDHKGQLWKIVDAASNTAYVGSTSNASSAISGGYDADGRITTAYDSAGRTYAYSYSSSTIGSAKRLESVIVSSGGNEIQRVEYAYYPDSPSSSYGEPGDLKTVTRTTPMSDSGINLIETSILHYWEGAYNSVSNPGYVHQVKLAVGYEGSRRYEYSDTAFDGDLLTESTTNLKAYAAAYFEYDTSRQVSAAWFNGQCGCSGGVTGTHAYRYETNGSYTNNSGYDATWCRRTSVQMPDHWVTQYFDEVGQPIHRVITNTDPAGSPTQRWVERVERDGTYLGSVTEIGMPDNLNTGTYDHSAGTIAGSSSTGLVWKFTRSSSSNDKGFATIVKFQKAGTSGTAYFERSLSYDFLSKSSPPAVAVLRPRVGDDARYEYESSSIVPDEELKIDNDTTPRGGAASLKVEVHNVVGEAVPTAENGANSALTDREHHALDETLDFEKSAGGHVTYREYSNGQVSKLIEDADTTKTAGGQDFNGITIPTNFSSSGSPLHLKTTYTFDAQGRPSTTTLPDGRVTKAYYSVLADRRTVTLAFPKYVSGSGTHYGPVQYTVRNQAGKVEAQGVIAVTNGSSTAAQTTYIDETDDDPITAIDTDSSAPYDFGQVAQLRTFHYDEAGTQLDEERVYFAMPSSEPGSDGTHYDATLYKYDDSGRRVRVKEAHGTIARSVFDVRGRVIERWIGTNDADEGGTDNIVKVEELTYDSGSTGLNGNLTKRTLFIQDNTTGKRETTYSHDARGHVVLITNATAPHEFRKVDNLGRVRAVGLYSSVGGINPLSDSPATYTTSRVALRKIEYDRRGREWKSTRHKIDPSDGSDDDNLETLSWYDADGHLLKRDGEQLEKFIYDGLGRQTHRFVLAKMDDAAYADADDVSGDHILEEHQTTYDTAGNAVMEATIARFHDDLSTGNTGALDTNGDSDSLLYTAANVKGRIQISAMWYDSIDRLQDRVEYGTYGGSNFDRDGLSVPARSDTALRTTYDYNTDGTLQQVTDPKALVTRYEYDAEGRRTKVIANYVNGTPSSATADDDQTVVYEYTDGLQTKIKADLAVGETDQETTYTFGTTKGASAGDSKIATGHLLQKVTYPDSSGPTDVVTFAYNAQSQEIWKKDQAGNIIESDYDDSGRQTHRRVSTLDADFDNAVLRISTTYDSLGRMQLVTQYDNATVGSGSVVDEVKYAYDDWGNLSSFKQDRDSAVGGSGYYEVSYAFAKATTGRNTLRRTSMTMPNADVFNFAYSSSGNLLDADASRVTQLQNGSSAALVTYDYNAVDQVVRTYLEEPKVYWKLAGSSSGTYDDFDRFNRVTTSKWTKYLYPLTDRNFYKVDLAYDRNSNIVSQDDAVHTGHDVLYSNDSLNRLTDADEGTLSGTISSRKRRQTWTLSQTGNPRYDQLDLTGDGDYNDANELNDDRTHNAVNELTARDIDDNGSDNYSLTYDEAGNLTDDAESYEYEWDAFYRLRRVKNQAHNLVAEYWYNGLGYRLSWKYDTDRDGDVDSNDKKYNFAYDERWRMVATYRGSDANPKEQFLYHYAGNGGFGTGSYIDLVVRRDKDASTAWTSAADSVLDEHIYYCQNWRADVVALVDAENDGDARLYEWDKYSAYGVPFGIPGGDTESDGDCDATDVTQVQTWINGSAYDVRGDIDLDGDVDATDKSTIQSEYQGLTGGRGVLSNNPENRKGYSGYEVDANAYVHYLVRHRVLAAKFGRWLRRDPVGYSDGLSMYVYGRGAPATVRDPSGLLGCGECATFPVVGSAGGQTADPNDPLDLGGCPSGVNDGGIRLQQCQDRKKANLSYQLWAAAGMNTWDAISAAVSSVDCPAGCAKTYSVQQDSINFNPETEAPMSECVCTPHQRCPNGNFCFTWYDCYCQFSASVKVCCGTACGYGADCVNSSQVPKDANQSFVAMSR